MMSSATSIRQRGGVRLKPDTTPEVRPKPDPGETDDAGFRPWHFFVLASLMAATVAVIMSRQARPEQLVLISLTIAAAGLAAAGFYRMLAPLAADDAAAFSEPLTERARATLEREKALVLRSIKELEFDRAMGKVSPKDFDEMVGRLRTRAMSLIRELDEGEAGYRALIERELAARLAHHSRTARDQAPNPSTVASTLDQPARAVAAAEVSASDAGIRTCSSCGGNNDQDASFCKRCGTRL
jgi:ribosomal protein L40E